MAERRRSLGAALDQCVKEATEEWFRQHRGHRSREEAAASDWKLLTTTSERRRGGYVKVYVGIVTHDRNTTEMSIWHWRWSDTFGYVRVEKSKAAG